MRQHRTLRIGGHALDGFEVVGIELRPGLVEECNALAKKHGLAGLRFEAGSIADTPRRKNTQTGQWEDAGETLWIRFSIWNAAAEALAEAARKGDQVTAVGRLRQRSYERDGQKHVAVELDARSVAIVPKPLTQE